MANSQPDQLPGLEDAPIAPIDSEAISGAADRRHPSEPSDESTRRSDTGDVRPSSADYEAAEKHRVSAGPIASAREAVARAQQRGIRSVSNPTNNRATPPSLPGETLGAYRRRIANAQPPNGLQSHDLHE